MAKELIKANIDQIETWESNHQALTSVDAQWSRMNMALQRRDRDEASGDLPWWGILVLNLIVALCRVIGLVIMIPVIIIGTLWDMIP